MNRTTLRALSTCTMIALVLGISFDGRTDEYLPAPTTLDRRPAESSTMRTFASLTAKVTKLDRDKRGRMAAVSPLLRELPTSSLLPLLEVVAFDPSADEASDASVRIAMRVGLLDAIAGHRDVRARASFERLLSHDNPRVVRAAASALGRLGDDAAIAVLVTRATTLGPARLAVLAGLGSARRLRTTRVLVSTLDAHPIDEDEAITLIHALGEVGSSWAWRTPSVAEHGDEERDVRAAAARALVTAFVHYGRDVRKAASNALMMVDDPSTKRLVAEATTANPTATTELDALARRFDKNPAR